MVGIKRVNLYIFLAVFLVAAVVVTARSYSQAKDNWDDLKFAAYQDCLQFFDPATGRVYIYSGINGTLDRVWELKDLGKDLEEVYARNPE